MKKAAQMENTGFKKLKLMSGVRGLHKIHAETSCHLQEMCWKCHSELS